MQQKYAHIILLTSHYSTNKRSIVNLMFVLKFNILFLFLRLYYVSFMSNVLFEDFRLSFRKYRLWIWSREKTFWFWKNNHARHVRILIVISSRTECFKKCLKTCVRSVFETCRKQFRISKQCNNCLRIRNNIVIIEEITIQIRTK